MQKFWQYEICAITLWGFSLAEIASTLQIILLLFGLAAAVKAWYYANKPKKPPVN